MQKHFYKLVAAVVLLFSTQFLMAQNSTQIIRGSVNDKQSKLSLMGATVQLMNTEPLLGDASAADGKFKINNVPVGRYDLKSELFGL